MVQTGQVELRISDADRDRAAAVLHTAVGDGRITWAEHAERLEGVYTARTARELQPLLADLAPQAAPLPVVASGSAEPLRVTFAKVRRRPDPAAGPVLVDAFLGAAEIDLRDLPPGVVVDVRANSLFGKVEIRVSPGTRLHDSGTAYLGKRSVVEWGSWKRAFRPTPVRPDGPVVRVSGHSMFGHVRVTIG
ncbi:DUF1707 SHOCT-like domain-containing protein [Pseudonocardia sp. CA-107938]|uniref:DUF1707 SHOCT-like domain-containing protein n=1 Tax=Pseudonocardia sp. CA-107938 TaxID=3240021 RepID=UPI003D947985